MHGHAGDDELRGNDGADVLEGGAGADRLFGGAGPDTLSYRSSDAGVTVTSKTVPRGAMPSEIRSPISRILQGLFSGTYWLVTVKRTAWTVMRVTMN